MRTKENTKRGFTLVEVIVVLVILAILAAIMIPAMTGWIDKAKEKRLIVECRTCVTAAQTLAVEDYGVRGRLPVSVDEGDVLALARVPGSVSGIVFGSTTAALDQLTYSDGAGESVTYYREPTPRFEFGAGGAGGGYTSFSGENVTAILDFIKDQNITITEIDSGSNGTRANQILAFMREQGIDPAVLNVQSWKYTKGNASASEPGRKGPFFYWTEQDISGMNPGDIIPVMRYNAASGSYTVWEAEIETKTISGSAPYNVFKDTYRKVTDKGLRPEEETYDRMVADYQAALAGG